MRWHRPILSKRLINYASSFMSPSSKVPTKASKGKARLMFNSTGRKSTTDPKLVEDAGDKVTKYKMRPFSSFISPHGPTEAHQSH